MAIDIADHHVVFVKAEKGERGGWKAAKRLQEAYEELAQRHEARGDLKEATEARERALQYALRMGELGRRSDPLAVANAQRRLSIALSEVGSFEAALKHAQDAEAALDDAAFRRPDAHRASWAAALNNLGGRLGDLGRYEEALTKTEQAEPIFRDLAERQPDPYRSVWAGCIGNLGACLGNLGRYEEALIKTEQAEMICRDLAERHPDAYRAEWSRLLDHLGSYMGELGRYEEALIKAEQAEMIYRDLAERQPDAYRADWSGRLVNVANHLRNLGRYKEALAKTEQAVAIRRELADRQPEAYLGRWALALGNQAEIEILCGQASDAVPIAHQGADVLAELAIYPNVHRDWLGWCTRVLAEALLTVGDAKLALEKAREADGIWATIFVERPAYVSKQYGKTLPVLARAELVAEGPAPAIRTLEQGIKRIEPYFEQRPAALQKVMQGLIETFQQIDPAAAQELVPASVIETLSQLPQRA